ncbi:MAG: hypothetical protein WC528_03030 [Patescibacteria group bacterium]
MPEKEGFKPSEAEINQDEDETTPEIDQAGSWGTEGLLEGLDEALEKSEAEAESREKDLLVAIKELRDIIQEKAGLASAKYEKLSHSIDRRSREVYEKVASVQSRTIKDISEKANALFETQMYAECEKVLKIMIEYFDTTVLVKE